MSIERCRGIILRTRPLTETSLVVQWLTPEAGRLSTLAKGARRPKSPFRGRLDLFFLAEFSFFRSRRSQLHTLRETVVRESWPSLRQDYARLRQAAYGARLIEQTTETETPIAELYDLVEELIRSLAETPARPEVMLAFELRFLAASGLQPNLERSQLKEPDRRLADQLLNASLNEGIAVKPADREIEPLEKYLGRFLLRQWDRIPKGREEAVYAASAGSRLDQGQAPRP